MFLVPLLIWSLVFSTTSDGWASQGRPFSSKAKSKPAAKPAGERMVLIKPSVTDQEMEELLMAEDLVLEKKEDEWFQEDLRAIEQTFPQNPRRQWRTLLLREYLNIMLESGKKYALLSGSRDIWALADGLQNSPVFRGLYKKSRIMQDTLANQTFEPIEFISLLLPVSFFLEKEYARLKAAKAETDRWEHLIKQGYARKGDPEIQAKIEQNSKIMGEIFYRLNFLLAREPTLAMLMEPVTPGKDDFFFQYVMESLKRGRETGARGEVLLRQMQNQLWPQVQKFSREMSKGHFTAVAYAWRAGTSLQENFEYFMRHHGLKDRLLERFARISPSVKDQWDKTDIQIGEQLGIYKFNSVRFVTGVGVGLAGSSAAYALGGLPGIAFGIAATGNFYLQARGFREATAFGAATGLNTYEVARRASESKTENRILTSGIGLSVLGLTSFRAFGGMFGAVRAIPKAAAAVPATIKSVRAFPSAIKETGLRAWAGAHKEELFGMAIAQVMTVAPYPIGASKHPLDDFRNDQNIRFNLVTSFILNSILGYYWRNITALSYPQVLWIIAGSQGMLTTIQSLYSDDHIKLESVVFDVFFVSIFAAAKSRFVFRPFGDYLRNSVEARFAASPVAAEVLKRLTGFVNSSTSSTTSTVTYAEYQKEVIETQFKAMVKAQIEEPVLVPVDVMLRR
ncbi:MAG: hypothetical protein IT289_12065 [Oligoflexia bacterium]|nr:hypothetical protein [Oligoflexia bacterium]